MKKFFEVWQVIGFVLVAIVLWPFLAPWLAIVTKMKIMKEVLMGTNIGRNKWFRLVISPVIIIIYIPALIIDLTVGYGIVAYGCYLNKPGSFKDFMKLWNSKVDEYLDSVKD